MERGERAHVPRGEGADGEGIGPKRQQERSADGESRGSARGEGTGGEGRDLQVERAQGDLGGGGAGEQRREHAQGLEVGVGNSSSLSSGDSCTLVSCCDSSRSVLFCQTNGA